MSSVVDLCLCSNKHVECSSSLGPVQTQNKRLCFLASAIRCYSCKDYTASCSKQRDCSYDDACLTLNERGVYMCTHYAKILVETNWMLNNKTFLDLISNAFCLNVEVPLIFCCSCCRWNDVPSVPEVFRLWVQSTGTDVSSGDVQNTFPQLPPQSAGYGFDSVFLFSWWFSRFLHSS